MTTLPFSNLLSVLASHNESVDVEHLHTACAVAVLVAPSWPVIRPVLCAAWWLPICTALRCLCWLFQRVDWVQVRGRDKFKTATSAQLCLFSESFVLVCVRVQMRL